MEKFEIGNCILEIGNGELELGIWNLELGTWNLENENGEPRFAIFGAMLLR